MSIPNPIPRMTCRADGNVVVTMVKPYEVGRDPPAGRNPRGARLGVGLREG
jgi:hypothetical protein